MKQSIYDGVKPGNGRQKSQLRWHILVIATLLALAAIIASMVYVVRAKYQMNDYVVELGLAFNAATLVNATETHLDGENAVIAEYDGNQYVIIPENYKPLQSYLRRDYAMPPFGHVDRDGALHVSICGKSHIYIRGDADGQGATLLMESSGQSYVMHVSGGDLWQKIVDICTRGFGENDNIPL